jgi:hypothetical protein
MRRAKTLRFWLVLAGFLVVGPGCGPGEQPQAMPDARFHEKVRVFEADMLARSQDLETRLDILQGHGLNLPEGVKDKWLEGSEKFANAQEAFKTKLQSAHDQTPATWNAYQAQMNQNWEAVEAAFQELKKISGKKE